MVELFAGTRATNYDSFVHTWIPGYYEFLDLLPLLLRSVSHKTLLVAGCGTGAEISRFSSDPAWKLTGVDPSPEMIAQARGRFSQHKCITLVEGTVDDLPLKQLYGAATLLLVLHFIPDDGHKLKLLTSIAQRLTTGAKFVLFEITGDATHLARNLAVLRTLLAHTVSAEEVERRITRIQTALHVVSAARIGQLLEEAGFTASTKVYQHSIYAGWLATKA